MKRLHHFEKLIDEKLRGLFRGQAPERDQREIIEVHAAILDEVAAHTEKLPRGRLVFPYSRLVVSILVPAPERRRAYEVVFSEAAALARDIRSRLEQEEAEMPERFDVEVNLVGELPAGIAARGFDISYGTAAAPAPAGRIPAISLRVLQGTAAQSEVTLRKKRVNIGRLANVLDAGQRLLRRNDVAFEDTPANASVSRSHAHLEFDGAAGVFRLFDDRSAAGTAVLRGGEIVQVPRGSSKGVALESGDEIVAGQARILFELPAE